MKFKSWRILVQANVSGAYSQAMEVEFRETIGGATACSGGTPIYSTQYNSSGNYSAAAAFDGSNSLGWSSAANDVANAYIGYRFANPIEIRQLGLRGWADGSGYALKNFVVQASHDEVAWVSLLQVCDQTGWGQTELRTFNIAAGTLSGNIIESLAITDWVATATRCADGVYNGSASASGTTYNIPVLSLVASNIVIAQKVDYAWSASKVVALNEFVVASNPDTTPHLWKVTTAGTFASTEATWNLSGTTTQGTAVLTYVGALVDPKSLGPKIPS